MINFSTYSLTLTATPPSSNPPPDWLTAANGTYTYTGPIPVGVGGRYTNPAGHTCDIILASGSYDFLSIQSAEEWATAEFFTESEVKAGGSASFIYDAFNAITVTWSLAKIGIKSELIYGETPEILEDSLSFDDNELGSLDEGTVDLLTTWPGYIAELTAAGIQKNELCTHPDIPGYFFVKKLRPKPEGSARAIVAASLVGQIAATAPEDWEERRLREISAFGQIVSVGPLEKVIIAVSKTEVADDPETPEDESLGGTATVKVKRRVPKLDELGEVVNKIIVTPSGSSERWSINDPGITCVDTYFTLEEPDTDVIGSNLAPPDAPTPPAYQWGSYEEPMRANHPAGWVLADRKITEIIPGRIWRVVDTFEYYQPALPD